MSEDPHVAIALRQAAHAGTFDPPCTRTLVTAARLVVEGLPPRAAGALARVRLEFCEVRA